MLTLLRTISNAAWAPIAVFSLHMLLSQVLKLYVIYPDIDIPMHLLGGVAIGFYFHRVLCSVTQRGLIDSAGSVYHALAVFGLVCAAAIAWEGAEFLGDRYFGTHSQGGMADTMLDMLLGASGGACLIVVLGLRPKAKQPSRWTRILNTSGVTAGNTFACSLPNCELRGSSPSTMTWPSTD